MLHVSGNHRILPVANIRDGDSAQRLAEALLAGGLSCVEVVFRNAHAEEVIRGIATQFPEMVIGAGTLLDPAQVVRARDAGAAFGLAPGLNAKVVQAAAECGLPFFPGVMTPTFPK